MLRPAGSAGPVAYVYVSTPKGIYGSNGEYFISLGTDYVHAYAIASNGAIKQQVSQINTQNYSGASCGTTGGAVLDHTGQYLYVSLNTSRECDALQSTGSIWSRPKLS